MAKFTYTVTVTVPDEDLVPDEDDIREGYCEEPEGDGDIRDDALFKVLTNGDGNPIYESVREVGLS